MDINPERLTTIAEETQALGREVPVLLADVGVRKQVSAAVDHAALGLGGFDSMVNVTGISQVKPLLDVTPEEIERTYRINVQGTLCGIHAAASKF